MGIAEVVTHCSCSSFRLFHVAMWLHMKAGARFSDEAVRHFHSQLDSEAYDDIVRDSDDAFRNSESRDELVKFLAGVHSKLGPSRGFNRTNIFVNANTNGTFIKVTYQSTFDQGNAVEAFTWKKAGTGLGSWCATMSARMHSVTR